MHFKIKGAIRDIETIATGHGINNLSRLNKIYGKANWRKLYSASLIIAHVLSFPLAGNLSETTPSIPLC